MTVKLPAATWPRDKRIKLSHIIPYLASSFSLGYIPASWAEEDYFNPYALNTRGLTPPVTDLSQFITKGSQRPGAYRVEIYINKEEAGTQTVNFITTPTGLKAEISVGMLRQYGVRTAAFPKLNNLADQDIITDLADVIPAADSSFNFNQQRLDISIPQTAMEAEARGYVNPASWDQGLPALMLNYAFSGENSWQQNSSGPKDSYFLNLRSGANLGAWRARNYSTYSRQNDQGYHWDSINSYLQRDIHAIQGQLTLGETFTPGDLLNSVQFRGVQLSSDEAMLPDSLRGYAPVVRGIANSFARVTIRQNGHTLYQANVPPGSFAITDLYPTGGSGNLHVTITEENGEERHFVQPYAIMPNMQREGHLNYSTSIGKYRASSPNTRTPLFIQSGQRYGMPYGVTLSSSQLFSGSYQALLLGAGFGLDTFGSLAFDITQANTQLPDETEYHRGLSYRVQYGKDITQLGTYLQFAGYQFSSNGFYDFNEANRLNSASSLWENNRYAKRNKLQLNLNQALGQWGSISLSGYQQDFWHQSGIERNLNTRYYFDYNAISYSLSINYTQSAWQQNSDRQLAFSMQMPLSHWLPNSWGSYRASSSRGGPATQNVGIGGTALADNRLSYNLQTGYSNNGEGANSLATATYKGRYGNLGAGYSQSPHAKKASYQLQGGIVGHPYGVTLSQPLGETSVLVRAPGASEVSVQNNPGVATDWRGYTVVPYLSAYRKNRLTLDTTSMGNNLDIEKNTQSVIPTRGALVLADFNAQVGQRIIVTLTHQGAPLPFGAQAELISAAHKKSEGIMDNDSRVYFSGMPNAGRIRVSWGNQQCEADYKITEQKSSIHLINTQCL
ncbi:TPA: fimbria/pilus outer membrane usher protein [Serratia fonticola]